MLVFPSRRLVRPEDDNNFVKGTNFLKNANQSQDKIGNSSDASANTKTMTPQTRQYESSSPPPLPPLSPPAPPKLSLTPAQQNTSLKLNDADILNKGKGNLYVMIDSNRKFIIFRSFQLENLTMP